MTHSSPKGAYRGQSLAVKLVLSMVGLTLLAIGSITWLSVRRGQAAFRVELEQKATLLLDALDVAVVRWLDEPMTEPSSINDLHQIIQTLENANTLVLSGHVYDSSGRAIAQIYGNSPEHFEAHTYGDQVIESEGTSFYWHSDRLFAGRTIYEGTQNLGAIGIELSTAPLQASITRARQWGLLIALITTALSTGIVVLISRSIVNPLRAIIIAAQRIASGHFDEQVSVQSGKEFSALADAFNAMTQQLRHSMAERSQAEIALRESEERYALAVQGANDGLWDWNLRTGEVYFSPRWKEMLGYADDEIDNWLHNWFDRVHPEDTDTLKSAIAHHLQTQNQHLQVEYRMRHRSGDYIWILSRGVAVHDNQDIPYRISGSQTDITSRKEAEFKLFHAAFHDALTELPNRLLLIECLEDMLKRSHENSDFLFVVLFLDIDRFKVINDSLGHTVGDELLLCIAQRLKSGLCEADLVARLGGDEFVILVEGIHRVTDAVDIAERIQQKLRESFSLRGYDIIATASIGIVLCDSSYTTSNEILRDADISMYQAKERGKAQYAIFHPDMHRSTINRLKAENDLRTALDRCEFDLHYQPIVDLSTEEFVGFEALIRWQHRERGWVSPVEFIPIAEETGLIIPIGTWVLSEACHQVFDWNTSFSLRQPFTVSVNLSSDQIAQSNLVDQVTRILSHSQLSASQLKIEITESVIMENLDVACYKLQALQHLGVQIYIDDFGTGYSSLGYLQKLPVDALKIDCSFIQKIGIDASSEEIVRTILMLANGLGKKVIAEGIETVEQKEWLQRLGCHYAQGYLFSKPLSKSHATDMVLSSFRKNIQPTSYMEILGCLLPESNRNSNRN